MSYCDIAPGHPFHGPYHDTEYGFPAREDSVLFERLALEINQAGLSWLTVLMKRDAFRAAFDGFDVAAVARYGEAERARLLADAGIIRNRLKIDAVIANARTVEGLIAEHGSFADWLDVHHPLPMDAWVKLFREDLPLHRGRDHGRIPDEHRLPARRACRELPGLAPDRGPGATLGGVRTVTGAGRMCQDRCRRGDGTTVGTPGEAMQFWNFGGGA